MTLQQNQLFLSSALHKTLKMQHLGIDIQPSPSAQKSVNIERKRKEQRAETLIVHQWRSN